MGSVLSTLIHPNLLASLGDFYAATCTIQQNTPTADTFGEPVNAWANVSGLVGIPCSIAPNVIETPGGGEARTATMTLHRVTHHIALQGHYAAILPEMRLVSAGVNYDIIAVEHDSHAVQTRLKVELVSA